MQSALDVYHLLTEGNNDLRQPVGLETQLLKESSMDSEVGMSMLQLLSVDLLSKLTTCIADAHAVSPVACRTVACCAVAAADLPIGKKRSGAAEQRARSFILRPRLLQHLSGGLSRSICIHGRLQ